MLAVQPLLLCPRASLRRSRVLGQQVVHVGVHARLVALHHISVGGVQEVVAVVEAILRDAVVSEIVVQVEVQHQLWGEHVVDERYIVGFLYIEVGVTISQCDGVGLVDVGIQVADTRTRDTHVVGQTEVTACAQRILQAGGGNE